MAENKFKKLSIDQSQFLMDFARDADYPKTQPQSSYLDRNTGKVICFFDEDHDAELEAGIPVEENRETKQQVKSEPDRYIKIPDLEHEEHHEILKAFLASDWIDNQNTKQVIADAYFKSIGGWKNSVDQSTINEYYKFRDQRIVELAEEFLRLNSIIPDWK